MFKPVLTIAVPTYNRSDLLENLINSVITEGVDKHFQLTIIVCDNSENNKTKELITKYHKLINILYFKNEVNIGATRNVLRCVELSKSGYIHIVSDKTIFHKSYISIMLDIVKNQPPLAFLNYSVYNNEGVLNKGDNVDVPIKNKKCNYSSAMITLSYQLTHLSSLVFRYDALSSIYSEIKSDILESLIPQTYIAIDILSLHDRIDFYQNKSISVRGNQQVSYDLIGVFCIDFLSIVRKHKSKISVYNNLKFLFKLGRWILPVIYKMKDVQDKNYLLTVRSLGVAYYFFISLVIFFSKTLNFFKRI